MPSQAYGYSRSQTVSRPAGTARRQIPWKPSQPAIASQLTSRLVPSALVYRRTGASVSRSSTSVPFTSNSTWPPAASRASMRSFTTSVCA